MSVLKTPPLCMKMLLFGPEDLSCLHLIRTFRCLVKSLLQFLPIQHLFCFCCSDYVALIVRKFWTRFELTSILTPIRS